MPLAAWFFCNSNADRRPLAPVARSHLGNGARLDRINWAADPSENGMAGSFGIMVNYLYQLDEIERNHEMFANKRVVVASPVVIKAAKAYGSILAKQKPVETSSSDESPSIESAGVP